MTTNEAPPPEKPETKSAAPAEGQKLAGCYLLKTRVGSGETGELWQANDEVLGRDISLQFIPDKVRGDAKAVGDVRQEIKRNRQLIHPNILRVYDFIEEPDWAAVSMDAFEGESLASQIGKRSSRIFSVGEIEPWVTQLCQTLEDAHKIGLIHRDISPANIYFRPDGRLFLAGFGFSRCVSDALRRVEGGQHAAPANLSPQLLDGQPAARTDDIYACGALLFELLTGQAPCSGAEAANQTGNSAPKAVRELRPKDLEPVPESWERTIAASLSKNPAERPPSAAKLAERLTAAPVSESAVLAMLAAAPAEVKETAAERKEAKESKMPSDAPASAPVSSPAPTAALAPASVTPGRRSISMTADPSAASVAPAPKSSPEKASPLQSSIPPKTTKPKSAKTAKPDAYSSVYGNRSRFPVAGIAWVVVALLVIGAAGYYFLGWNKWNPFENASGSNTSTPSARSASSGNTEAAPLEHPLESNPSGDNGKTSPPNENPVVKSPDAAEKTNTTGPAGAPPATHGAPTPPKASLPASSDPAEIALAQKQADLDKARQAVGAAEQSVAELTKQQQTAETSAAAAQKALDEKSKRLTPAKKAVDDLLTKKKKLEDEQKAADAAAQQAKQAADEKQRLADAAKQAVDDLVAKNQDKLAVLEKADVQLAEMKKAVEEKQQLATAAVKARADAEAERAKQSEAVRAGEQAVADATAVIAAKQKAREANKEALRKLEQDAQDLRKKMEEQFRQIEEKKKALESGGALPDAPASASPGLTTPPPIIPSSPSKTKPVGTPPRSAPPATSSATPSPNSPELAPLPKTAASDGLMPAPPEAPKVTIETSPPETAPVAGGNVNSLGQKFVPVGNVDFCIWQTRVKDFEVFARDVKLKSVGWRSPGFKQGPDHPVVNVTWQEAVAFCKWLTDKEHKEGLLPANQFYRLPTDLEWSKAVGLPPEPEKTPAERDMVITDVYPWGKDWPPPPGAGNYTGEETGSDVAIKGYDDGFAWTSPVGSFKPNRYGLYDMGGNVWQWCMDSWNDKSPGKVLRGASWYNGALKLSLLSSCRVHAAPDSSTDNYGFRIVKVTTDGPRPTKKK